MSNILNECSSNSSTIVNSKISKLKTEIGKSRSWSDRDIKEFLSDIPAKQVKLLLKHEIERMDDWLSKTYYPFKNYLIKNNLIKFDKKDTDFEALRSKMKFIDGCINSIVLIDDEKFDINHDFYPSEIIQEIKRMEKYKSKNSTVQVIGEKLCRCLLCLTTVSGNIYDHILGKTHKSNLSNSTNIAILSNFHEVWDEIPKILYFNQCFFLPYSLRKAQCCVCDILIGYTKILEHINGKNHQKNSSKITDIFIKSKSKSETVKTDLNESKIEKLNTTNQIKCDICNIEVSQGGLQEHMNGRNHQKNLSDISFRKSKNNLKSNNQQIECDICNISVTSRAELKNHLKGRQHKTKLCETNSNKPQPGITKINKQLCQCNICNILLNFGDLKQHINGKNHQSNLFKTNNSEQMVHTTKQSERDKPEQEIQLPVNNLDLDTKFTKNETNAKLPTYLQQTNFNELQPGITKINNQHAECNICNIVVTLGGLQEHINGKNHQSNVSKINNSEQMVHTPKQSERDKPEQKIQFPVNNLDLDRKFIKNETSAKLPTNLQQTNFNELQPGITKINNQQAECNICNIVVTLGGLQEHINGKNHQSNLSKINNSEQMVHTTKQSEKDKPEQEIQIPVNNLNLNHTFIENETSAKLPTLFQQGQKTQVVKFAPYTYYPIHLLKKMKTFEGKIFRNVQFISESNYRCLLCKMFVDDLDDHISESDHLKLILDHDSISSVEKFHNSWAVMENSLQFQQRYFFPVDETLVTCILCQEDINYNKLSTHLSVLKHSCLNMFENTDTNSIISSSTTLNSLIKNGEDSNDSNLSDEENESDFSDESSISNIDTDKEKLDDHCSIIHNGYDSKQNLKLSSFWESLDERLNINRSVVYWKNGIYSCHICHIILQPNKADIISHIVKKTHVNLLRTCGIYQHRWSRLVYECLYCNKRIYHSERDWQNHMTSITHVALTKQKNIEKSVEFYCRRCGLVLYGGDNRVRRDHNHKKTKNKEIKMPDYLQTLFKSYTTLETFVQEIFEEAMDVLLNNKDEKVCQALINEMKPYCLEPENCKAYRFGSRVTGLCSKNSDLDIFLDLNNIYDGIKDQEPDIQAYYVKSTCQVLQKFNNIWTHFEAIPQARTPILKVYHQPTKTDCDISFRNGLSVENTKLLSFYFDLQPITRKVILFLKYWSYHFTFDQRINNYALSLMVIFYLQIEGYLYSVSELRKMYKGPQKLITGWNYTFYNDVKNIVHLPCNLSHIEILRNFFQYYSTFNYEEHVICPLLGRIILKKDFQFYEPDNDTLPDEMNCYKDYIKLNNEAELFRSLSPLCVQDPFDLSHNLTKAVPVLMVIKFTKACEISYKALNDILQNNSS